MEATNRRDAVPARSRAVFLQRRALVALGLAVMLGPWIGPAREALSDPAPVRVSRETYLVRPGDTLWSIAQELAPGQDPRPLVDAIAEANGLDGGAIAAGATIVVPAR